MVTNQWLQTLLVITVAASQITFESVGGNFGLTSKHPVLGVVENLILNYTPSAHHPAPDCDPNSIVTARRPQSNRAKNQICDVLKLEKRQRRMCKKKCVAQTLLKAVQLSTSECQRLFRFDRWNCSIGKYRTKLLRQGKGFPETSFLHAISAASLTHTVAQDCSNNRLLDRCSCANPKAWKWGGCGDNIRHAVRFTRHFLSVIRKEQDIQAEVDYHNSRVGIQVVRQKRQRVCKCHGASGSCVTKTCWTRLSPFHETAKELKQMYRSAERVIIDANDSGRNLLRQKHGLVYLNKSPNFCTKSAFSPGISGRVCNGTEECDFMCCGRGYNTWIVMKLKPCECTFRWCCETICKKCLVRQEMYVCK